MNQTRTFLPFQSIFLLAFTLSIVLLAGCGGGGGGGGGGTPEPTRFPIDDVTYGVGIFGMRDLARPGVSRVKHMPVLSGAEFIFDPSLGEHRIGGDERLHVGVHSQAAGDLAMVGSRGETGIRHGTVNDGVGRPILSNFLDNIHDAGLGARKYVQPPVVRIVGDASDYEIDSVTGGDDGRLTGVFVGANHEGATGVLERIDLTAAFGAAR